MWLVFDAQVRALVRELQRHGRAGGTSRDARPAELEALLRRLAELEAVFGEVLAPSPQHQAAMLGLAQSAAAPAPRATPAAAVPLRPTTAPAPSVAHRCALQRAPATRIHSAGTHPVALSSPAPSATSVITRIAAALPQLTEEHVMATLAGSKSLPLLIKPPPVARGAARVRMRNGVSIGAGAPKGVLGVVDAVGKGEMGRGC